MAHKIKILQGRQEKLLLTENGERGDEFQLAVLSRVDSQEPSRPWLKKQANEKAKAITRGDWTDL